MPKKVIVIYGGTFEGVKNIKTLNEKNFKFKDDVIRIYFSGCQKKAIGGRSYIPGFLDPNLDVAASGLRSSFAKDDNSNVQLNLASLKKAFGNAVAIEPHDSLDNIEEVSDVTLSGFSRGAVTTFAAARKLNDLDVVLHIAALDPVPGTSRDASYKENSEYGKNCNLTDCQNLQSADVLLGTYSKHSRWKWENKWFRQMAPKFNEQTLSHIYITPKKYHSDKQYCQLNHLQQSFYNAGLTSQEN